MHRISSALVASLLAPLLAHAACSSTGESPTTSAGGGTTSTHTGTGGGGAPDRPDASSDAADDGPAPELAPEVVAAGLAAPFAITAGPDRIYWSDVGENGILACPPDDCQAHTEVVAPAQTVGSRNLRYAGGKLFWATPTDVSTCDPAACSPVSLVSGDFDIRAIATDGTTVFYADDKAKSLLRITAGSAPAVVAAGVDDVRGIALDGGFVYFTTYGIQSTASKVLRCPQAGCTGAPTELQGTGATVGAHGVALTSDSIYWTDVGHLRRCPKAGCTADAEVLVDDTRSFEVLVPYDGKLAWSSYASAAFACEGASCAPTLKVFDVGTTCQDLALGPSHVYVIASSAPNDGRIIRFPR